MRRTLVSGKKTPFNNVDIVFTCLIPIMKGSNLMKAKKAKESRIINTAQVLSCDLNNYNTLFGGVLMKKLDDAARLSQHADILE